MMPPLSAAIFVPNPLNEKVKPIDCASVEYQKWLGGFAFRTLATLRAVYFAKN